MTALALKPGEPIVLTEVREQAGVREILNASPEDTRRAKMSVLGMARQAKLDIEEKIVRLETELGIPPAGPSAVLAMLRKLEWEGSSISHVCAVCRRWKNQGHSPECELARLLTGGV